MAESESDGISDPKPADFVFLALGESNLGKHEVSFGGYEFFSFVSKSRIQEPSVAMGLRYTATGNSVSLGQIIIIMPPKCRKKEEFYFLGCYFDSENVSQCVLARKEGYKISPVTSLDKGIVVLRTDLLKLAEEDCSEVVQTITQAHEKKLCIDFIDKLAEWFEKRPLNAAVARQNAALAKKKVKVEDDSNEPLPPKQRKNQTQQKRRAKAATDAATKAATEAATKAAVDAATKGYKAREQAIKQKEAALAKDSERLQALIMAGMAKIEDKLEVLDKKTAAGFRDAQTERRDLHGEVQEGRREDNISLSNYLHGREKQARKQFKQLLSFQQCLGASRKRSKSFSMLRNSPFSPTTATESDRSEAYSDADSDAENDFDSSNMVAVTSPRGKQMSADQLLAMYNAQKAREDENKSTKEMKVASKHKRDVTPSTSSSRKAPRRR